MKYKHLPYIALAIALSGCTNAYGHLSHNSHGPIPFDYSNGGSAKSVSKPVDTGPCPTCGGDACDAPNGGNSGMNDDKTDNDQHRGNGETHNDHEAQHDEQCAPVSNG